MTARRGGVRWLRSAQEQREPASAALVQSSPLARLRALAEQSRRPLAGAARGLDHLLHSHFCRRPGLLLAGAAGALDGHLRVRHFCLCLHLGDGDRCGGGFRPRLVGAELHPALFRQRRIVAAERISLRQPLAGLLVCNRVRDRGPAAHLSAQGLARRLHHHPAGHRLPHPSGLRRHACAGRHRALLQLAAPRISSALYHPATAGDRIDGNGMGARLADRRHRRHRDRGRSRSGSARSANTWC